MAQVGRALDPWQAGIVIDMFGRTADGLWAAFEVCVLVARQNGKGLIAEAQELAALFLLKEPVTLHSAHEFKTSTVHFRRLVEVIDANDWLRRRVKAISRSKGDEGIELTRQAGGAMLKFVARTGGSGRGFTAGRLIFDEAYALTAAQYAAQTPTMATLDNPQVTYTSTPPDEETGPMPEDAMLPSVRRRGMAGDPRMAYYEWSPAPGDDPADPAVHAACNPGTTVNRVKMPFLASQLRAFTEAGKPEKFATEHLGQWPDEAGPQWSVVTEEQWLAALDAESTIRGPRVFSVDSAPDRSWTCISVAGKRADGDLHGEVIELRPGMDWAPGRLAELVKRWRPPVVSLVGTGQAYALHPDIVREVTELGMYEVVTEVKVMTNREVVAAHGLAVNGLTATDGRRVRIRPGPHGEVLAEAVKGGVSRDIGEGKAWDRAAASVNLCPVICVTNALHTFASAKIAPPVGAVNTGTTGPATAGSPLRDRGGLRAAAGGNLLRSGGRLGR
jgi:hypothetical protein